MSLGAFCLCLLLRMRYLISWNALLSKKYSISWVSQALCLCLCVQVDSGCYEPNDMSANTYGLYIDYICLHCIHYILGISCGLSLYSSSRRCSNSTHSYYGYLENGATLVVNHMWKNMVKWGIPEKSIKNVAQGCWPQVRRTLRSKVMANNFFRKENALYFTWGR